MSVFAGEEDASGGADTKPQATAPAEARAETMAEEETPYKPDEGHLILPEDVQSQAPPSFAELDEPSEKPPAVSIPENLTGLKRTVKGEIRPGDTLSTSFARYDIGIDAAGQVVEALKGVFDFRRARAGNCWEIAFDVRGEIESFTYHYSTLVKYYARMEGEALHGYEITGETQMYVVPVAGTIEENLSTALWKLGESDVLTMKIADIYAWDIDFFSDIQPGDTFRVLVEKHYYNGKFVRYGDVLAALFEGTSMDRRYAFYFQMEDEDRTEYFDADGNSLQKSFLRAPLNTVRVTSKFGFRMHPTLKKYKQHNGVDYGAPRGTPVWAIASGKVLSAGWMGPCGKGVKLKHANHYVSIYCHLSSINVRAGERVAQKKMVGRVGNTGRSTGPHLHFGMMKNGRYINPMKLKYEPGKPVPGKHKDRWQAVRTMLKEKLEAVEIPAFYGPELPPGYEDPTRPPEKRAEKRPKKAKRGKKSKKKGFRPRPEGIKRAPG